MEKNVSKCDQKTNGRNKRKYVPYTQTHTSFNHIMKISYGTGEEAIQPEEGWRSSSGGGHSFHAICILSTSNEKKNGE